MAKKKIRSVFWVVSTHVLTTGFALPAVAGLTGLGVLSVAKMSPLAAFLVLLTFQAVGYIGGVFYSLSYIRRVALLKNPVACITPSIITFAVLALIGFALNVSSLLDQPWGALSRIAAILAIVLFFAVVGFAFAKITRRGFTRMEPYTPET